MENKKYLVRYSHHFFQYGLTIEEIKFVQSLDLLYENDYYAIYRITDSQELEFNLNNYEFATIENNREIILRRVPTSIRYIIEELV